MSLQQISNFLLKLLILINCQLQMKLFASALTVYLFLLLSASPQQIPFQVINQTLPYPTVQFYAGSGQVINVTIQFDSLIQAFVFFLFRIDNQDDFLSMQILAERTITKSKKYSYRKKFFYDRLYVVVVDMPYTLLAYLKITVSLNNQIIREHYATLLHHNIQLFQFQSLTQCEVKIYWYGPYQILKIYPPDYSLQQQQFEKYDAEEENYIQLQITKPGKWTIGVAVNNYANAWFTERAIINITTTSQKRCVHSCSDKPYPVVGLAPGTQNICICDEMIPFLVWDVKSQQCKLCGGGLCSQSICKNKVREKEEQCDNGGQPGCSNCTIQPDYTCKEDQKRFSICEKIVQVSNTGVSTGVIIGIVLGSISFVALAGTMIYCYLKKLPTQEDLAKAENPQSKYTAKEHIINGQIQESKNRRDEKCRDSLRMSKRISKKYRQSIIVSKMKRKINPTINCRLCFEPQCNITLACQHCFHTWCILEWLTQQKQCPLCKGQSSRSALQFQQGLENNCMKK